ncbi:plasmid mobilization protein [Croceimicrobium sp.]|uniref:plasmid mobilization protein n=1 Tax=Croceimicrobium sp. TaxID=2828340 RepID=UPI003BAC180E
MARPTKNIEEKQSEVLRFRCTPSEKNSIQEKSSQVGLSLSDYMRAMALDGQIKIQQSKYDFELVHQLKKLGVNINQQTKKLNATGVIPIELKRVLPKLEELLDQLLEDV